MDFGPDGATLVISLTGGFEIALLQVTSNDMAFADAEASMRRFDEKVLPNI